MSGDISATLLIISAFLLLVSAIQRYANNLIIPGVTIMMFIGAVSVIVPLYSSDFKSVYDSIVEKAPDLILLVIIPLLIFESARKLRLKEIKSQITPIGFYATAGVIFTIFLVGVVITIIFKVPIINGLLFGSIVAATDAAAVAAVFKRFPIPHRLNLIIEGESLFNDATGVISFNVIKGIIFSNVAFSLLDTSVLFIWSMLGAVALGSAIGYVGGRVINRWQTDDYVNFTFSIALAIGGYIIGDHVLHVSGVVTTVFIALLMLRTQKETITRVGQLFHVYWDYLGFITNSFLFFLVGIPVLSLFLLQSSASLSLILIAPFTIVMASRVVVVYGGSIMLRIARVRLPLEWQKILIWGGLRGGICIALVLSLPAEYEFKNLFATLTISLIAVNLVINPILLGRYLKKSKVPAD
jgi:monovalent cation:H+ antiporter, CPA1 family